MHSGADFSGINEAKVDMGSIYDRRDPRAYYSTLQKLDYVIPVEAKPIFQKLISQLRRRREQDGICVLDFGLLLRRQRRTVEIRPLYGRTLRPLDAG